MSDTCNSCGAPIRWSRTLKGSYMPLDAEPNPDGNVVLYDNGTCRVLVDEWGHEGHRHTSHFATCPNAMHHRRRKAGA
jgi:hypothetical protein